MKKLIALCLVLGLMITPCFATLTPTLKGMMQTANGTMIWGTFTGLGANTAGSTTITLPRLKKIITLPSMTWEVTVVSTSGACAVLTVSGAVVTVSQEVVGAVSSSSGYFRAIGK